VVFDIGDQPTITGYFTALDTGEPANPSAITIRVRKPDGSIDIYDQADCTNPTVGTWRFLLPAPIDQEGQWIVKFYGTAGIVAAQQIVFAVTCSKVDA
jgi:hypothetical protein